MHSIVNSKETNDVVQEDLEKFPISSNDENSFKHDQKDTIRTKRSYVPVEIEKRQQLIKAVEEEGLTIKEAA